jgi:hypothetical protein
VEYSPAEWQLMLEARAEKIHGPKVNIDQGFLLGRLVRAKV